MCNENIVKFDKNGQWSLDKVKMPDEIDQLNDEEKKQHLEQDKSSKELELK